MTIRMNLRVYRTKWKYLWWTDTAYNFKIYELSYKIVENQFVLANIFGNVRDVLKPELHQSK